MAELPDAEARYLAVLLPEFAAGEAHGHEFLAALVQHPKDWLSPSILAALRAQARDEERHASVFAGLVDALRLPPPEPRPDLVAPLFEALEEVRHTPCVYVALHGVVESCVLAEVRAHAAFWADHPSLHGTWRGVGDDEARHVRLGARLIAALNPSIAGPLDLALAECVRVTVASMEQDDLLEQLAPSRRSELIGHITRERYAQVGALVTRLDRLSLPATTAELRGFLEEQ